MRLFISCQQLVNVDLLSLTDPVVELQEHDWDRNTWHPAWKSGVIWNELNPAFVEAYEFDFFIDDHKRIMLKVYDVDREHQDLRTAELVGEAEFLISEVVTKPGMIMTKPLMHYKHKEKRGLITLRLEDVVNTNEVLKLGLAGTQLQDPRNWFGRLFAFRSYFRLSRAMETGGFQAVYSSPIIAGRDPTWNMTKLTMSHLCNCDYQRPILIEVFCEAPCGMMNPVLVGRTECSIAKLLELGQAVLYLDGPAQHNGSLLIKQIDLAKEPTFLDYISNGCELGLIAAVDFTGSNGDPSLPSSLHYTGTIPNQYEYALKSVADVLVEYDADKRIPIFGFGAITHQFGLSHCFPLNGNPSDPEVEGVYGMLSAYRNSLSNLQLSGPTYFAPVIRAAIAQAEEALRDPNKLKYYVLLILTDGIITDMQETIDCIVHASHLPISIVIVGIGNANFSNMEMLDADVSPLKNSSGTQMQRDIVQFVPFNSVKSSVKMIRKEVLTELPADLVNYYSSRGQLPRIDLSKVR